MTRPLRPRYAGLVSRLAGLAVDSVLLTASSAIIIIGVPDIWKTIAGDAPGWVVAGAEIAGSLLPFAYFAGCWWLSGQTFGAMMFGTVVRRPSGAHLSLWRAAARAVVGLLLPGIWLIGMVSVLWEPRRRAWHDRLFDTVVRYRNED